MYILVIVKGVSKTNAVSGEHTILPKCLKNCMKLREYFIRGGQGAGFQSCFTDSNLI